MTDTKAGFALMDDADIVAFIKKNWRRKALGYEVTCAFKALGYDLVKRYRLLRIAKKLFGGFELCTCEDCVESGTKFYKFKNQAA